MFFPIKKSLSGFSTPEVLLSVFVVSIGLVTIMTVMSGSLRFSFNNRDIIIATDLAQEGVELVRNVRDNDFASGGTGFSAFDAAKKHCYINWSDANFSCFPNQNPASRYYLQYAGGLYAHNGGAAERYSRYLYIDYDSTGGDHALVRSFVFWGSFQVSSLGNNGNSAACKAPLDGNGNPTGGCVFSEAFFTAWK